MNDKRILTSAEQKQLLLDMLKYIDKTCRDHGIKYSLISGSLIGAVRHHGFIPWDDDIDIALTKENYFKLKQLLDMEDGIYQTIKYGKHHDNLGFMKLIDTRTQISENNCVPNTNYGIFVDIFCYFPTSNNETERRKHYNKMHHLLKLVSVLRTRANPKSMSFGRCLKVWIEKCYSRIIGYHGINKMMGNMINKYNVVDTEYVLSGWPLYSFDHEIQFRKDTEEYIDIEFEKMNIMVFKNYDRILKTQYGNYMELPPESERVAGHNIMAWWKDGYGQD